jgi:hypothetical protein
MEATQNDKNELNKQGIIEEELDKAFDIEEFNFDAMEEMLDQNIEELTADLKFLVEERENIGNPDELSNIIQDVIMEQFQNQISSTVGEDFIKENNGLNLDLRKSAHFQSSEDFAKGKIALHNTVIDYQQRYDTWQSNFERDEKGDIKTHRTRTGKEEATLVKDARKRFDKGRPKGSAKNGTDMDHTVSAGEIIRDPVANAHLTPEEQENYANSRTNLNEMPSSWNRSKGDSRTGEWLDTPNANGQKPDEIFDMSPEDKAKLRQKDKVSREEYERKKKEGEQRSFEAGKKSQKEEAFRIGKSAVRTVVLQLLADLVKEIVIKLVKWFKSGKRKLNALIDSIKEAIHDFVRELKQKVISAGNTMFSMIITAIVGPIVSTLKKVWSMLKQGWRSLKGAIDYLRNQENKSKPLGVRLMEAGKIVIAGMTGIGAMLLSETIEKGLISIPLFAVQIPLLGSLANILGMFFGAVVSGIVGAIIINHIEKLVEKRLKEENIGKQIDKGNEILSKQQKRKILNEALLERDKANVINSISDRRQEAYSMMTNAYQNIMEDFVYDFSDNKYVTIIDEEDIITNEKIDKTSSDLDDLLSELL